MPTNEPWPHRLERVRRGFGWSYRQLGEVFGVSSSSAYYWCKGESRIPPAAYSNIALLEKVLEQKRLEEVNELGEKLVGAGIAFLGAWAISEIFGSGDEEEEETT